MSLRIKDLPGFRQSFCEPDSTRLTVYFRSKAPHKTWQVWFSYLNDIGVTLVIVLLLAARGSYVAYTRHFALPWQTLWGGVTTQAIALEKHVFNVWGKFRYLPPDGGKKSAPQVYYE